MEEKCNNMHRRQTLFILIHISFLALWSLHTRYYYGESSSLTYHSRRRRVDATRKFFQYSEYFVFDGIMEKGAKRLMGKVNKALKNHELKLALFSLIVGCNWKMF